MPKVRKNNINKENYNPTWRREQQSYRKPLSCIVAGCTNTSSIIHSQLYNAQRVAELLQVEVSRESALTTALCEEHYKRTQRKSTTAATQYKFRWTCGWCTVNTYVIAKWKSTHPNPDHYISGCAISLWSSMEVEWDTSENVQSVKDRVAFLTRGYGCKSGCKTGRCKCFKAGRHCGPGCTCTSCHNSQHMST